MARKRKRTKRATGLSAALLRAFEESGLTRFGLATRAGVPYASVFEWAAGRRGLTLDTASKIADVLDLTLAPKKR